MVKVLYFHIVNLGHGLKPLFVTFRMSCKSEERVVWEFRTNFCAVCLSYINNTKYGKQLPMSVTKVVVTWCQILWLKCTKLDFGRPSWGTSQHSSRPHCWIYGKKGRKWLGEMEGDWEIDENREGRGLRSGKKSWEGKWKMEGWRKGWRWEEEGRRWGRETMSCYGSIFKPWHWFESHWRASDQIVPMHQNSLILHMGTSERLWRGRQTAKGLVWISDNSLSVLLFAGLCRTILFQQLFVWIIVVHVLNVTHELVQFVLVMYVPHSTVLV